MLKHFDEPYLNGNCYYSLCICESEGEAKRLSIKHYNNVREKSNNTVEIHAQKNLLQLSAHKKYLENLKITIDMLNSILS